MRDPLPSGIEYAQVFRAYKVELEPNREQIALFIKHADAARWAWNYGLGRKRDVMSLNHLPIERIKIPTTNDLQKEVVQLKATIHPWLAEVSKEVPQSALDDLDRAFKNLYENHAAFPRFKLKKRAKRSFRFNDFNSIRVGDNAIRLPFMGWVMVKRGQRGYLPQGEQAAVRAISATVSERAERWFVALLVEENPEPVAVPPDALRVGIDRGLKNLAVLSDGFVVENPRALARNERKLKRLQRSLNRKQNGSANYADAVRRLERYHLHVQNVRKDALHKATTTLARAKAIYVVETLTVRAMMANHHLAKSIADASWAEFVRQLEYKAAWYGSQVVRAHPRFPSSQLCSGCGRRHSEMKNLDTRTLCCECGLVIDRDLNAAVNLSRWPEVLGTVETPVEAGVQAARPMPVGEAGTLGSSPN